MNKRTREQNSIRNIVIGFGNQIVVLVLNMISKRIFIEKLGQDYLGINGLFTNLFLLFSFAEFGMGAAMIYSLYKPIAEDDQNKISGLYHFFASVYKKMAIVIAAAGLCVLPILPVIVNTSEPVKNIWLYYLLFLGNTVVSNMFVYRTYLVIADQKRYIISLNQLICDGLCYLVQIGLLLYTSSYILYLIAVWTKTVISSVMIQRRVRKEYGFLKNAGELEEDEKHFLTQNMKELFSYKFAKVMLSGTDNLIISVMLGTALVGRYSNYDLVVTGVVSIISMIFSSVSASVGNIFAKEDMESQYRIYLSVQQLSIWIVGFTSTCLFILFQDFITLWVGKDILLPLPVVAVIVINYYISSVRDSSKMFREASGLFKHIKNRMWACGVLNIILSVLLAWWIGIAGVFLGTTLSMLFTVFWFEPRMLYQLRFLRPFREYIGIQVKSMFAVVVSIALAAACTSFLKEVTIGTFLVKAMICAIVSNLFYFAILFRTEGGKYVIDMLKRLIKRK